MTGNVEKALIDWSNAAQRIERLRQDLSEAETNLMNARNELGKIMSPEDAEAGETSNVWVSGRPLAVPGDRMLTVTYKGGHDYLVNWREKPKAKAAGCR